MKFRFKNKNTFIIKDYMDKRVAKLLKKPQPKQLTPEWFNLRKNVITASSMSSLLIRDKVTCDRYIELYNLQETFKCDNKCCNPYSSKLDYFKGKVIGNKFTGSTATYWGQKYEPIVQQIYSINNKTSVLEFGLLQHSTIPFLSCSPDGITPQGVMLEIKCPFRRQITGIPPFYYWLQCMCQLEVCDLDFCDFVEYSFNEYSTKEEWLDEETLETPVYNRGLFIQIEKIDESGNILGQENNEYFYPEHKYIDDTEQLLGWAEYYLSNVKETNKIKVSIVYYKVVDLSVVRIAREKEWFKNILPVLEKEWKKIQWYKQGDNYLKLIEEETKPKEQQPIKMNINHLYKGPPPGLSKESILSDNESDC
jgi:putative phage-type endonuclease